MREARSITPSAAFVALAALFGMFLIVAFLSAHAQETRLVMLDQSVSAKTPAGATFTAHDVKGTLYTGHVITTPPRHWGRRGSLRLVFDDPAATVQSIPGKTLDAEGAPKASIVKTLAGIGAAAGVTWCMDDCVVDNIRLATGSQHKAWGWYALDGAVGAGTLYLFKGGNPTLKQGQQVELQLSRTLAEK